MRVYYKGCPNRYHYCVYNPEPMPVRMVSGAKPQQPIELNLQVELAPHLLIAGILSGILTDLPQCAHNNHQPQTLKQDNDSFRGRVTGA